MAYPPYPPLPTTGKVVYICIAVFSGLFVLAGTGWEFTWFPLILALLVGYLKLAGVFDDSSR